MNKRTRTSSTAHRQPRQRPPARRNAHSGKAKPFRPTKAMRDELVRVLAEIEFAVAACVTLRRWSDLEAAVLAYALMMGADPCLLLHSALLRPMARYAMTLTDPAAVAEHIRHIAAALEWSESRMPLYDSVELLRVSVEHAAAFAIFDSIHTTPPNAEVH